MNSITVEVSQPLDRKFTRAARAQHLTKSEIIRQALTRYLAEGEWANPFVSAAALAGDLIASVKGEQSHLAINSKYTEDFGR